MAWTLARYPDKLCDHEVLCNSFRNPAHLAKMAATLQALSGGGMSRCDLVLKPVIERVGED